MNNIYRALAFAGILSLAGCAAAPNGDQDAQEDQAAASPPPSREVPDSRTIPPQPAPARPTSQMPDLDRPTRPDDQVILLHPSATFEYVGGGAQNERAYEVAAIVEPPDELVTPIAPERQVRVGVDEPGNGGPPTAIEHVAVPVLAR